MRNVLKKVACALAISPLFIVSLNVNASSWVISDINITFSDSNIKRQTYANGRMQAPVTIAYKAVDPNTYKPVYVSPSEIQNRMTFWDKYQNRQLSSDEYSIDDRDNGWNNVMPTSSSTAEELEPSPPMTPNEIAEAENELELSQASNYPGWQYVNTFISAHRVNSKVICVKIAQPDGSDVLSCDDVDYSKSITLESISPIRYQISDLQIADSDYTYGGKSKVHAFNYYISAKNGKRLVDFTLKPTRSGKFYFRIRGDDGHTPVGWRILQRHYDVDVHCNVMATIWKPNTKETTVIRDVTDNGRGNSGAPLYGIPDNLAINQVSGAINITMYRNIWSNPQWRYYAGHHNINEDPILHVTDEYGNDSDTFSLHQYNNWSSLQLG